MPLDGTAIVPVGLDGAGLIPADVISVEPSGIPVGETDEPADALPSGEVAPIVGVGATIPVTCARATWPTSSAGRAIAIEENLMFTLRFMPNEPNWDLSGFSGWHLLVARILSVAAAADTRSSLPDSVGKIDDNGCRCAPDHNPPERLDLRRVDLHVRQKSRNVNKVARLRLRPEFPSLAPSYLADAVENERNGFLASVMVDSRPSAWLDFKNATPQSRMDGKFRCNSSAAFRTRCLGGAKIELLWADNADRFVLGHGSFRTVLKADASEVVRAGGSTIKLVFRDVLTAEKPWCDQTANSAGCITLAGITPRRDPEEP